MRDDQHAPSGVLACDVPEAVNEPFSGFEGIFAAGQVVGCRV
jgi:hypothetical protein